MTESIPSLQDSLVDPLKKLWNSTTSNQASKYQSGMLQQPITEPIPNLLKADNEKVIEGNSNAYIILGRDRPRGISSGRGGGLEVDPGLDSVSSDRAPSGDLTDDIKANPQIKAGRIDIIAGLNSALVRETNKEGEKVLTNPSPELDAARIYLSQKADPDSPEYWNLAPGSMGQPMGVSTAVIIADATRIIGREGIKIVTGNHVFNSHGWHIGDSVNGIDLIAGNDDKHLQPIAKAKSVEEVFNRLVDLVDKLHGHVQFLYDSVSAPAKASVDGGASLIMNQAQLKAQIAALEALDIEYELLKWNYASWNPWAKLWFGSPYNNTN